MSLRQDRPGGDLTCRCRVAQTGRAPTRLPRRVLLRRASAERLSNRSRCLSLRRSNRRWTFLGDVCADKPSPQGGSGCSLYGVDGVAQLAPGGPECFDAGAGCLGPDKCRVHRGLRNAQGRPCRPRTWFRLLSSAHGASKIRPFTCPASIRRCASGASSRGRMSV